MFYGVYQITNLVNGRYYRGAHKTRDLDDGYFGSGTVLQKAIRKYGRHNFHREYLFFAFDEAGMIEAERLLVVTGLEDPLSYNLVPGGGVPPQLPWSEARREMHRQRFLRSNPMNSAESRDKVAASKRGRPRPDLSRSNTLRPRRSFLGRTHSQSSKKLQSEAKQGEKHPQFGMRWITDGRHNRKTRLGCIPEGWILGRAMNRSALGKFL